MVTAAVVVVVVAVAVIVPNSDLPLGLVLYPLQMPVANVAGSSQV